MNPQELKAFEDIVNILQPLDAETRSRVLAYANVMLGKAINQNYSSGKPDTGVEKVENLKDSVAIPNSSNINDIRSLKEEKNPASAVEMAVLVAYYLQELAPSEDRKESIGISDLTKYFKQARYRLPVRLTNVTNQAKDSGYLDRKGQGQYSLNPVGYNLAVHGLPRSASKTQVKARKPRITTEKTTKEKESKKAPGKSQK